MTEDLNTSAVDTVSAIQFFCGKNNSGPQTAVLWILFRRRRQQDSDLYRFSSFRTVFQRSYDTAGAAQQTGNRQQDRPFPHILSLRFIRKITASRSSSEFFYCGRLNGHGIPQQTIVPASVSPCNTRSRLVGSEKLNTIMGKSLSRHMENAVESITLS